MSVHLALVLLLQLPGQSSPPVLTFPERGLDDPAAYEGYATRFYRDSKGNTVQVYLDGRSGRVVQVWADAFNESLGFTARDGAGRPARVTWGADDATVSDSGATRTIEYRLTADASRLDLGWFVLGSMRVERDFQYPRLHLRPFTSPPFRVAEESTLVAALASLPPDEQARHLEQLGARTVAELRGRLQPTVTLSRSDTGWSARVARPSLDGRNHLWLELRGDAGQSDARMVGRSLVVRRKAGGELRLTVRAMTDAPALTPLRRDEIFNADFLDFLGEAQRARGDSAGTLLGRRLERLVRGVELLSSEEKLMAGLPNYATYFGRDMMMTALMMRPIWAPAMSEHVVASVLRKLSPEGGVSHEEALGGQAIREHGAEYAVMVAESRRLVRRGERTQADSVLAAARDRLGDLQRVRENYMMRDDEFQLPVLAASYLADPAVPAERKRAFLVERTPGGASHLSLLLRELGYVTTLTAPYARDPSPENLVEFPRRDSTHWYSASWRDSGAGYAGGRFAMDINALWAPQALAGIADILAAVRSLGFSADSVIAATSGIDSTPVAAYLRDSLSLRRAVDTWRGARRHFEVAFAPAQIEQRVAAKLASLPVAERQYWSRVMRTSGAARESLGFLALSLDGRGRPIPVVSTDPATGLFLHDMTADVLRRALPTDSVLRLVDPLVRPYPVGLFVDSLGTVVANDAYASPAVWRSFEADTYHSPRVVWGREVNLVILGIARQIGGAYDEAGRLRDPGLASYVGALQEAMRRTSAAVDASGFSQSELWSYRVVEGRLRPVRYGIASDLQLWSSTDLAVQYVLSRLPRP